MCVCARACVHMYLYLILNADVFDREAVRAICVTSAVCASWAHQYSNGIRTHAHTGGNDVQIDCCSVGLTQKVAILLLRTRVVVLLERAGFRRLKLSRITQRWVAGTGSRARSNRKWPLFSTQHATRAHTHSRECACAHEHKHKHMHAQTNTNTNTCMCSGVEWPVVMLWMGKENALFVYADKADEKGDESEGDAPWFSEKLGARFFPFYLENVRL